MRSRYLEPFEHRYIAETGSRQFGDLGACSRRERMSAYYLHAAPLEEVVRTTETEQDERQEQNAADDEKDLETFQRRRYWQCLSKICFTVTEIKPFLLICASGLI